MRCLSLIQPYATLWALGIKTCETRSWPTEYRGELYIHASKSAGTVKEFQKWNNGLIQRLSKRFEEPLGLELLKSFEELPRGFIIGKVEIVSSLLMTQALIDKQDPIEIFCGEWKPGRFAFTGRNHQLLDHYIPAKGQLGIWEYDPIKEAAQAEEKRQKERQLFAISSAIKIRRKKRKATTQPSFPLPVLESIRRKFEL